MKKKLLFLIGLLSCVATLFGSTSTRPYNPSSPWGENLLKDISVLSTSADMGEVVTDGNRIGLVCSRDTFATLYIQYTLPDTWNKKDLYYATYHLSANVGEAGRWSGASIAFSNGKSTHTKSITLSSNVNADITDSTGYATSVDFVLYNENYNDTLWVSDLDFHITACYDTFQVKFNQIENFTPEMGSLTKKIMGYGDYTDAEVVPGTYYKGEHIVLNATPNTGYYFVGWNDGTSSSSKVFSADTEIDSLYPIFKAYKGKVYVKDGYVTGGVYDAGGYFYKDSVKLYTYSPANCVTFKEWSDGITENPRYWSVSGTDTIRAYFNQSLIPVSVLSDNEAMGSADAKYWDKDARQLDTLKGTFDYDALKDSTLYLYAYSNLGYKFVKWSSGSTSPYMSLDVNQLRCDSINEFIAYFAKIDSFNVVVMSADTLAGTVTGGGVYAENKTIQKSATAKQGYTFSKWVSKAGKSLTTATCNDTIVAYFSKIQPVVSVRATFMPYSEDTFSVSENIATVLNKRTGISTDSSVVYPEFGDTIVVTAKEVTGYKFKYWYGGQTFQKETTIVCTSSYYDLHSYYVSDSIKEKFFVDFETANDSMGSVSYDQNFYTEGDTLRMTATPKDGYVFDKWVSKYGYSTEIATEFDTLTAYFKVDSSLIKQDTTPVVPDSFYVDFQSADLTMGYVSSITNWFAKGDSLYKTAIPNDGYLFDRWESVNGRRTDLATSTDTLIAYFKVDSTLIKQDTTPVVPDSFYVDFQSADLTMGYVSSITNWFAKGDSLYKTAIPNDGYLFDRWESVNGRRTDLATSTDTLIAYFKVDSSLIKQDTTPVVPDSFYIEVLTDNSALGTVKGSGLYEQGSSVTIEAEALDNAVFDKWSDGVLTSQRTVVCDTDASYIAYFKKTAEWSSNLADTVMTADTTTDVKKLYLVISLEKMNYTTEQKKHLTLNASVNILKNSECTATIECYADAALTHLLGSFILRSNSNSIMNGLVLYNGFVMRAPTSNTENYSETGSIPEGTNYLKVVMADEDASTVSDLATEFGNLEVALARKVYDINLESSNDAYGSVTGAGEYQGGDTATVKAVAAPGYTFVCWSDSVTTATRNIIVENDSTLKAYFEEFTSVGAENADKDPLVNIYTVEGYLIKANVRKSEALEMLNKGFYIVGDKKVYVTK